MNNTTEEQLLEIRTMLTEVKGGWAQVKTLPDLFKTLQDENTDLKGSLTKLRKEVLTLAQRTVQPIRKHEVVTHDCARYLAAIAYIGAENFNKLSPLKASNRDLIINRTSD